MVMRGRESEKQEGKEKRAGVGGAEVMGQIDANVKILGCGLL